MQTSIGECSSRLGIASSRIFSRIPKGHIHVKEIHRKTMKPTVDSNGKVFPLIATKPNATMSIKQSKVVVFDSRKHRTRRVSKFLVDFNEVQNLFN